MARTTPLVEGGVLREQHSPTSIAVGTSDWLAWLDDEQHCSFHFRSPAGEFTARKERKQRGQTYWVAYRQAHCKLWKRYLGKAEALTSAHMIDIAAALTDACHAGDTLTASDPPAV